MMTKLIFTLTLPLVAALLFLPSTAYSSCATNGIWTWPQDSLATNGEIIITGYAMDQDLIRDFQFQNPRLVSDNHEAQLIVKNIYVSAFNLTQAVLAPMESLKSGQAYRLEIDSNYVLYQGEEYFSPNDSSNFIWRITEQHDGTPPAWITEPIVTKATVVYWGCGPQKYLTVEFLVHDQQPIALEVELEPTNSTAPTQKFILTNIAFDPETNMFESQIGHGMCSGQFTIKQDMKYRARFTAIDASGNWSQASKQCTLRYGESLDGVEPCYTCPIPFTQEDCTDISAESDTENLEPAIQVK